MAAPHFDIHVRLEWKPTEADGENCEHCGDRCFLRQHTLFMSIVTTLEKDRPVATAKLCGGCYDALRPELPGLHHA